MELQRWREKRGVQLNVHPKFWPFNVETADHLTVAIVEANCHPFILGCTDAPVQVRAPWPWTERVIGCKTAIFRQSTRPTHTRIMTHWNSRMGRLFF